jgi:hypothetical protein
MSDYTSGAVLKFEPKTADGGSARSPKEIRCDSLLSRRKTTNEALEECARRQASCEPQRRDPESCLICMACFRSFAVVDGPVVRGKRETTGDGLSANGVRSNAKRCCVAHYNQSAILLQIRCRLQTMMIIGSILDCVDGMFAPAPSSCRKGHRLAYEDPETEALHSFSCGHFSGISRLNAIVANATHFAAGDQRSSFGGIGGRVPITPEMGRRHRGRGLGMAGEGRLLGDASNQRKEIAE